MTTGTLTYDELIGQIRELGSEPVTASVRRHDDSLEATFGGAITGVEDDEPVTIRFDNGDVLSLDRDEFCGAWLEKAESAIARTPILRVATVDREIELAVD